MQSKLLATFSVDHHAMQQDLMTIARYPFSSVYEEFVCGKLKSCVLWNRRGDYRDTILESYEGESKETEHGAKLIYLKSLIASSFHIEYLKFARILVLKPNSVFMPHRDYLELKKNFIRIHIPLKTDAHCYHAEEDAVYHMNSGEIWYLDASRVHSAASFSEQDRLHLILDFVYRDNLQDLLKIPLLESDHIPDASVVTRVDFSDDMFLAIQNLKSIVDMRNFYEIFSILIKKYFYVNVPILKVYEWLLTITQDNQNSELRKKAEFIKNYCLLSR